VVALDSGWAVDVERAAARVPERVARERLRLDHQAIEAAVQRPFPRRAGGTFDLADHVADKGVGSGAKNGVDT
jgi:hypothetical protein